MESYFALGMFTGVILVSIAHRLKRARMNNKDDTQIETLDTQLEWMRKFRKDVSAIDEITLGIRDGGLRSFNIGVRSRDLYGVAQQLRDMARYMEGCVDFERYLVFGPVTPSVVKSITPPVVVPPVMLIAPPAVVNPATPTLNVLRTRLASLASYAEHATTCPSSRRFDDTSMSTCDCGLADLVKLS